MDTTLAARVFFSAAVSSCAGARGASLSLADSVMANPSPLPLSSSDSDSSGDFLNSVSSFLSEVISRLKAAISFFNSST